MKTYQVGEQVSGQVIRVMTFGLFVQIDGPITGFVDKYELAWHRNLSTYDFSIGQSIQAQVVDPYDGVGHVRLSIKALTSDPWLSFEEEYEVGMVARGVVVNLQPFGVFVELKPGVNGLIPRDQLSDESISHPEEVVWNGDIVEALIVSINPKERHIRLSLRQRLLQLTQANVIWHKMQSEVPTAIVQLQQNVGLVREYDLFGGSILIVDDELGICQGLVQRLCDLGYQAEGATSVPNALHLQLRKRYDVYVIDIQVGAKNGLEFGEHIRRVQPDAQICVMSVPEVLHEYRQRIEILQVIGVFSKPLYTEEIQAVLHDVENGTAQLWEAEVEYSDELAPSPFESIITRQNSGGMVETRLRYALESVLEITEADVGIVFHLDVEVKNVSMMVQIGRQSLNDDALYSLQNSPVGDVIRDQRPTLENYADTRAKKRFDKLLTLLSFSSCIGVPIPLQNDPNYALFLFHEAEQHFDRRHVHAARSNATLLATILEQSFFAEQMERTNSFLLSGQVSAGLQHEVNNKLSSIYLQLINLNSSCAKLRQDVPQLGESKKYSAMEQTLESVVVTVNGLRETVTLFQQLSKIDRAKNANVNLVLHQSKHLVTPLARRHNIDIQIDEVIDLPDVQCNRVVLQQVLLNLMLNAIQQTAIFRPENGCVKIEVTQTESRFLRIFVIDNGPGIHRSLWEKIFELGYSSRTEGSGQGLYIARSLIDSLGGHVCVHSSLMLLGTTFAVDIPIYKEE